MGLQDSTHITKCGACGRWKVNECNKTSAICLSDLSWCFCQAGSEERAGGGDAPVECWKCDLWGCGGEGEHLGTGGWRRRRRDGVSLIVANGKKGPKHRHTARHLDGPL